jgi:SAM-dependent methyltransferase
MKWPPEFDPDFYREMHADLRYMTVEQAEEHYRSYGLREGRICSSGASRGRFVKLIPEEARVLEIGPGSTPVFTGPNVRYFDVIDSDALKERAKFYREDTKNIPSEIHYVSSDADLSIVLEKFDAVFSSHAIEHQPNLLQHVSDVSTLLAPGGAYYVICPDCRYCFDQSIPPSSLGEVLEAYYTKRKRHRMADIIDGMATQTHNDSLRHWNGDSQRAPIEASAVQAAIDHYRAAHGAYIDAHAWRMTPESFRTFLCIAFELGLSPLAPVRIYVTLNGHSEFCAILAPPFRAAQ